MRNIKVLLPRQLEHPLSGAKGSSGISAGRNSPAGIGRKLSKPPIPLERPGSAVFDTGNREKRRLPLLRNSAFSPLLAQVWSLLFRILSRHKAVDRLRMIYLKLLHDATQTLCSIGERGLHMTIISMTPNRSAGLAFLPVQTPQEWRAKGMAVCGHMVP